MNNKLLYKYDKNTLIEKIDMTDKNKKIGPVIKRILNANGFKTLGDLSKAKEDDIKKILVGCDEVKEISGVVDGINDYYFFNIVKNALRRGGLAFCDEFEDKEFPHDVALIKITDLDLPWGIIVTLVAKCGLCFFGDLLEMYDDDIMLKYSLDSGERAILKNYIHSLGFTLKNEYPSEKLEQLRKNGEFLLENVFSNPKICSTLYRNGIYTIEDLLNFGSDVFKKVGFSTLEKVEVLKILNDLGYSFATSDEGAKEKGNDVIKGCVGRK